MKYTETHKRYRERSKLIYEKTYADFSKETETEKNKRIAHLKKDVKAFVEYYLPHYATAESADFQTNLAVRVKRNKTAKIIVRWGRGLAKSVWSDVIIPLWLWIQDDINYMVIVGNNLDKAKILLSDLQAEFESNQKLISDFGEQLQYGSWEDGYFRTKNGFIAKALGMGQSPRGLRFQARRPDYIVCDDLEDKDIARNPMRQDQVVQWIEMDLLPTMDGDRRRYLHPNNNFAPRSIQEELRKKHPDWTLHRIDAYDNTTYKPAWSAKYSDDYYKEVEKEIGILAARAEYNNQPHIEGKIFKQEQIQWIKLPRIDHFKMIVGFWDVAYAGNSKSDYNAVRVWGLYKGNYYYIDSFVRQSKIKSAVEWIVDFQKSLPENVIIHWRFEGQFWNDEIKRTLSEVQESKKTRLNIFKQSLNRKKKYDRILTLQPMFQNHRIFWNINKKNHSDTIIGLEQLYSIEPGYRTQDDAPDADAYAIEFLERHNKSGSFSIRTGKYKRNQNRKI